MFDPVKEVIFHALLALGDKLSGESFWRSFWGHLLGYVIFLLILAGILFGVLWLLRP